MPRPGPPSNLERRSRHHPDVQRLRRLASRRSARREERAFVIEGATLLHEALDAGVEVECLFVAPGAPDSVIELAAAAGMPVAELGPGVLEQVASTVTPQPVVALARWCDAALGELRPVTFAVVAAGVADPGNLGTLVRAAEAAGAGALIVCDTSVDAFSPKVVRAAAGALFRVPLVIAGGAEAVLAELAGRGLTRLGTVARGGVAYDEVDLTVPVAVVLGSEAHGLPAGAAAAVDLEVTIPMAGRVESLNVAVAGAVVCFEIARQRRRAGGN